MGWREIFLLWSFFVSICLFPQTKCGPVNADKVSRLNDENSSPLMALRNLLIRKQRAVEDCSGLQNDLEEMRIKCRDSYKVAKDNVDGLKTQLDDLFKQLDSSESPAKDVLHILQKIVDLQELDVKINTERDATKTARLKERQREAGEDLSKMKKQLARNVEMFERAGLKISAEMLESNKATSSLLTELKKYLEDKIKKPGEQDGMSNQVLQIVSMQIGVMELLTRVSDKYKTQAQINLIMTKLRDKNSLLEDLKEEREEAREDIAKIDKHIAAVEREILDLNAELTAFKQTLLQINGKTNEVSAKKTEIMDKITKVKGKDELISRILTLQFECMEALISAQGQIKAHEVQINDLQKELEKEQDRMSYLQANNRYLRKQLFDHEQECADMDEIYTQTKTELLDQINQMSDSTPKNTLQIILLGLEIDQIMKQIKASSSNNDDLKEMLNEKIKELKKKKEELKKNQANSDKILQVISQMEEIWKLQSEDPNDLDKFNGLQKNLLYLIAKLDNDDPTKPMLKIMALQSDVTWIREMLKTVTNQAEIQKIELQRKLKDKENMLNEKNKELASATINISQLRKEIAVLQNEVSTLKRQIDKAEETAKQKIKDLEAQLKQNNKELNDATKMLNEKDAEIAQQFGKINNLFNEMEVIKQQMQEKEALVNARIAALQDNLMKKEKENAKIREENEKLKQDLTESAECPELQEKYIEIKAEYTDTVSKLNSTILQQVFIINTLIEEVQNLDKKVTEGSSDSEELINELEEKKKELEEAKQKLKAEGVVSAKTLKVLQLLTELWKLEDDPTEENLAKIRNLEAKLNGLLAELQTSGEKGLELTLKMISIKGSMARLKKAQATMQEEYATEMKGLKKQIEDKEKEIVMLRANCEQSAQLKERIKQLEKEAKESRNKLQKLEEESKKKIASLQDQLKTKNQQLANTEDKLKETNAENAKLIDRLFNLNEDLKKITEEKNISLKKAQEKISELNELLEGQRKQLIRQDLKLREKDESISTLQRERDNVKDKLEKEKKKSSEIETQLKTKEQQLANTEDRLKKTNAENDALILKQNKLNKDLKEVTEEKNNLQKKTEEQISGLNKNLERQEKELVEQDQKIKEKDKAISTLQKERDNSVAELERQEKKYNNAVNENEKLRQSLNEAKKEVEELKEQNEKPTVDWPRLDQNTAHRRLILSKDEREARTSLLPLPVPNNPERYDTAIAVLGSHGYDTGRHYWEIGVAGRNCYVVGVARASAQRKGILNYGPKAGYWVIRKRRDGEHFAIVDKPVSLHMETLSEIGVLVDFKRKEITFYNAKKKHSIYKFTGNEFLGKLYPYIETCSDTNIDDPPLILKEAQSTDWLKQ